MSARPISSRSDSAPFGGAATVCALTVEPVTGFMKTQEHQPKPREVTVFFLPVVDGGPPVPVRVESQSRFGAVRIHLVAANPSREAD